MRRPTAGIEAQKGIFTPHGDQRHQHGDIAVVQEVGRPLAVQVVGHEDRNEARIEPLDPEGYPTCGLRREDSHGEMSFVDRIAMVAATAARCRFACRVFMGHLQKPR